MDQVVQIVGALLILVAFGAVQFERMRPDSRVYLVLNLVARRSWRCSPLTGSQWGFLLLESVCRRLRLGSPRRAQLPERRVMT